MTTTTTLSARAQRKANRKATRANPDGLLAAEAKAMQEDLDPAEAREDFEAGQDAAETLPEPDIMELDPAEYSDAANGTATPNAYPNHDAIVAIATAMAELDATDTMLVKKLSQRELKGMGKPELASLKERIVKAEYKFSTVRGDSPISVMRRILAGTPSLTMKPKDLKEALAKAGFPDTPMSTVNATLAGWAGDVRALRAAGRIVEVH